MKKLFEEVKQDIQNGYGYMTYDEACYDGQMMIIADERERMTFFDFERDAQQVVYGIPYAEFLSMTFEEWENRLWSEWYYNTQEIEGMEEDE